MTLAQNATRAIMFSDVSGSSALYKSVGNLQAKLMIDKAINFMSRLTESHQGHVVKTIGDEVMARFDSAQMACQCAIEIQQACEAFRTEGLAIRIGLSCGPTLLENGDVFGDTVNDAAFVAHIARGRQIVITQSTVDGLPPQLQGFCQLFDRVQIKGEREKTAIYRLMWESPSESEAASATTVLSIPTQTQQPVRQLCLTIGEQAHYIAPNQEPFVIGRDQAQVNLHIDAQVASRSHCEIVHRRGKYVLIDHSTNGCYVTVQGNEEIYLRREELPLKGSGMIGIGQPTAQAGKLLIQYTL